MTSTQQVCAGGCAGKFNVPDDVQSGKFHNTGVCQACYEHWAADTAKCFGKSLVSKAKESCQQCSELAVCLNWNKKGESASMKKQAAATAPVDPQAAQQAAPADPPKKQKKTKQAAAPAKPAAQPKVKAEKKSPYRPGSGLDLAYQYLAGGFHTLEEVVTYVGGKWKNPDFLKTTSLLKPGPDKPWSTEEKGGKYKIVPKK